MGLEDRRGLQASPLVEVFGPRASCCSLAPPVGAARRAGLLLRGLPEWRPAPPLSA